jgi:hypothetical protein
VNQNQLGLDQLLAAGVHKAEERDGQGQDGVRAARDADGVPRRRLAVDVDEHRKVGQVRAVAGDAGLVYRRQATALGRPALLRLVPPSTAAACRDTR